MSAQTPACQLLERYFEEHADLWTIAPPQDAWLKTHADTLVSADQAILDAWRALGKSAYSPFDSLPAPTGPCVLFWPKAHRLGLWWLAWLCAELPNGTPLALVGENHGGIKRVPKVLAELGLQSDKLDSARRCSLFVTRTAKLSQSPDDAWTEFSAAGLSLASHPGVFGHGKLDEGTALLLETLTQTLPPNVDNVLDMGCGDGVLAASLAKQGRSVTAVDVNLFAVEATRRTLSANQLQGEVLASDVYQALAGRRFDAIISNPPFHQERAIDYGPTGRLIQEAPGYLRPGGRLIVVANAFLPYPDLLEKTFGQFTLLADNRRFRVYQAGLEALA
ncbi:methyltransferase [Vreelandella rituensis]|uniref:Methyltransferase domain-containing protein n=1 Tax=Vreelandella rituensis TaxID=2282306 RepID=A0A368TTI0_9GAMM|nr:methyltransferase [Halomonas rituensis]RCV87940.1 methyltransferase domain-containing protein [Halomonas rituensis]